MEFGGNQAFPDGTFTEPSRFLKARAPSFEGPMTNRDTVADRLDAEYRETEARLEVLEAEADATKAKEQMAEISGLNATNDRVRRKLTELNGKQ
jgi:hypothetical protein